jgi:hypothetical protein
MPSDPHQGSDVAGALRCNFPPILVLPREKGPSSSCRLCERSTRLAARYRRSRPAAETCQRLQWRLTTRASRLHASRHDHRENRYFLLSPKMQYGEQMRPTPSIGNRNDSSWSMRPWPVLTWGGIEFDTEVVPLGGDGYGVGSEAQSTPRRSLPTRRSSRGRRRRSARRGPWSSGTMPEAPVLR